MGREGDEERQLEERRKCLMPPQATIHGRLGRSVLTWLVFAAMGLVSCAPLKGPEPDYFMRSGDGDYYSCYRGGYAEGGVFEDDWFYDYYAMEMGDCIKYENAVSVWNRPTWGYPYYFGDTDTFLWEESQLF